MSRKVNVGHLEGKQNCTISYQDGRVVKALDLSSNGRVVRVGSNPTPGNFLFFSKTMLI